MSRSAILNNIKKNQPATSLLPALVFDATDGDNVQKFTTVLQGIGGNVVAARSWAEIKDCLLKYFPESTRTLSMIPELGFAETSADLAKEPHLLENVTLAVLKGHFAVAENGAVWITDVLMGDRALPFICEHLALVVQADNVVRDLHEAYPRIDAAQYNFGTFIAGPSKTADIEQSLVLGAHGPKTLTVFLLSTTA